MRRIYLSVLLTVVGSLLVMGWILDSVAENELQDKMPSELQLYERILLGASKQLGQTSSKDLSAQVTSLSRQFKMDFVLEPIANLALPPELTDELLKTDKLVLQSNDAAILYAVVANHPDFLLQLRIEQLSSRNENLEFALTLALYIGVGISLALWLIPLTTRLSTLSKTANKFGAGKLEERIAPSRFSYIRDLELNFNRMASQIETLVADNKLLAESLSHDLRTPVSCLRFGIEAAIDTQDTAKRAEYLIRVEDELCRLESLLDAFLSYASMERKSHTLILQDIDLAELLASCREELAQVIEQKQLSLTFDFDTAPAQIRVDGHWVQRAFINLINNALNYAQHNVMIVMRIQHQQVVIAIHDDGPGIPNDKWDTIFSPFVTAENSRNRQKSSIGLGLAIVSRVVNWHQGNVTVSRSTLLNGACFTVVLPRLR